MREKENREKGGKMEILASLPTLKNRGNHPDGEENKTKKKRVRERLWGLQFCL